MGNPTNITVNYNSGTGVSVSPSSPEIKDGYTVNWNAQGGAKKITRIEFTDSAGHRINDQTGPFSSAPAPVSGTEDKKWTGVDDLDDDRTYYYCVYVDTGSGVIKHDPQLINKKKD